MKKILFVFLGESFRTGNQGTRIRGLPESINEQIHACTSHIELMSKCKYQFQLDTECVVITYKTKYDHLLQSIYNPYLNKIRFLKDTIGYENLCQKSHSLFDAKQYNIVFYIRIDLILKDYFIKIYNPSYTKIVYPFVCWRRDYKQPNGHPRISDLMVSIPSNYLHVLKKRVNILDHNSYSYLLANNVPEHDISYFINTYHDSDSAKDYNPLYKIANRPETSTWDSQGFEHTGHYDELVTTICPHMNLIKTHHIKRTPFYVKFMFFILILFIFFLFFQKTHLFHL